MRVISLCTSEALVRAPAASRGRFFAHAPCLQRIHAPRPRMCLRTFTAELKVTFMSRRRHRVGAARRFCGHVTPGCLHRHVAFSAGVSCCLIQRLAFGFRAWTPG